MELWAEEFEHSDLPHDYQKAEHILRVHNESVAQIQNTICQYLQQGQELLQVSLFIPASILLFQF